MRPRHGVQFRQWKHCYAFAGLNCFRKTFRKASTTRSIHLRPADMVPCSMVNLPTCEVRVLFKCEKVGLQRSLQKPSMTTSMKIALASCLDLMISLSNEFLVPTKTKRKGPRSLTLHGILQLLLVFHFRPRKMVEIQQTWGRTVSSSVLPGVVDDVRREDLQIVVDDELSEGVGGLLPLRLKHWSFLRQNLKRSRTCYQATIPKHTVPVLKSWFEIFVQPQIRLKLENRVAFSCKFHCGLASSQLSVPPEDNALPTLERTAGVHHSSRCTLSLGFTKRVRRAIPQRGMPSNSSVNHPKR